MFLDRALLFSFSTNAAAIYLLCLYVPKSIISINPCAHKSAQLVFFKPSRYGTMQRINVEPKCSCQILQSSNFISEEHYGTVHNVTTLIQTSNS